MPASSSRESCCCQTVLISELTPKEAAPLAGRRAEQRSKGDMVLPPSLLRCLRVWASLTVRLRKKCFEQLNRRLYRSTKLIFPSAQCEVSKEKVETDGHRSWLNGLSASAGLKDAACR
ncbi:hypothetical protein KIL84_001724 [Mauremys mutica]|uniref:Uncharacterized protein n=1 Tax=Mauremys mutica TaxID=74926 RepID=A0A9D3XKH0_9SAUR|nr:hypothetical protein KIL84_001724 [Mauremys mutica]